MYIIMHIIFISTHLYHPNIDIDECVGTNDCDQDCNNLPGSFECTCDAGYVALNRTHCQGNEADGMYNTIRLL